MKPRSHRPHARGLLYVVPSCRDKWWERSQRASRGVSPAPLGTTPHATSLAAAVALRRQACGGDGPHTRQPSQFHVIAAAGVLRWGAGPAGAMSSAGRPRSVAARSFRPKLLHGGFKSCLPHGRSSAAAGCHAADSSGNVQVLSPAKHVEQLGTCAASVTRVRARRTPCIITDSKGTRN
jgi:hypothetical protein